MTSSQEHIGPSVQSNKFNTVNYKCFIDNSKQRVLCAADLLKFIKMA